MKQEMLYIFTIMIAKIIHACICNLKQMSNMDVQQDYLTEKDKRTTFGYQ